MGDPVIIILQFLGLVIFISYIFFPVYLVTFWKHRKKAREVDPELMPSKWSPIMYACMLVYTIFFICTLLNTFLRFYRKAPQSEAKTNLGAIFTTQVAYFSEANTYASGENAFELLGWEPESETRYAYYAGDDMIPNTIGDPIPYTTTGNWPFSQRPETSETAFTVMAIGNLDRDDFPDVWIINDAKVLANPLIDYDNTYDEESCPGCSELNHIDFTDEVITWLELAFRRMLSIFSIPLTIFYPVALALTIRFIYRDLKKYFRLKSKASEAIEED